MAQGQGRKGTRAGKIRHKGRQEKEQGQTTKGTRKPRKGICEGFMHINKAINKKWCLKHINKAINRGH